MSLSILHRDGQSNGGIWCATDLPYYTLFKNLLKEIELFANGESIISEKEKLNKLYEKLDMELSEMMKYKVTSSKRKHNLEFEGKYYNLDMKSSISDRTINNLLITKNMVLQALETGNGIKINIE